MEKPKTETCWSCSGRGGRRTVEGYATCVVCEGSGERAPDRESYFRKIEPRPKSKTDLALESLKSAVDELSERVNALSN